MVASKTKAIPAFFMAVILLEARICAFTNTDTAAMLCVQRNLFSLRRGGHAFCVPCVDLLLAAT
jgi:Na+/H+ antiporter NhaD/arsenite permease-like protein